jgi:hypothetical protein
MQSVSKIEQLQESIKLYKDVIQGFEERRAQMLTRRRGAVDSVMVHLDESLALNERTLSSLKRVLASAKEQLQEERTRLG